MFLRGPFNQFPFQDNGARRSKLTSTAGVAATSFLARYTGATVSAILSSVGVSSISLRGSLGARLSSVGHSSSLLFSSGGTRWTATYSSSAQFVGSTSWDSMLEDTDAPIAYFAEIEPWVLADRS